MPNIIQIKRKPQANGAGVPNNLSPGELAFSEADAKLFYGLGTGVPASPIEIGGSGYVLSKIESSAGSGLLSNGTGNDTLLHVGAGDGISVSADAIAVDSTVVRNTGDKYIGGNTTFGPNGTSASVTITDSSEGGMGFRIKSYTFSPTNSTGAAFDLSLNAIGTGKVTTLTTSEITSDITIVLPSGSGTLARLDDITTTNLTGTLAVNKGGTGQTSYSNGQLLIGSGTSLARNTLTPGTGVGITNGSGTITINTNATSANTASAIVSRDASGNFSAGGVTATSITVDGTISARSSASANVATQIPVFTGDPSSTTRSVVTRTPAQLLSDIGAYAATNPNGYTSNAGTVTAVSAGSGMNFSPISSNGNVVLGTPSSVTLSSTNSLSATSHTHAFAPGGTTSQYLRGDGSLATFPSIPTVNDATLTLNVSGTGLSGSQTFTANQSTAATFTVTSNATSANTASAVVARDASGNFSAGTITASLNGNANTVTSGVYTDRSITINGTTNQITSSAGAQDLSANRTWTLSLPQDINSTATPTFGGLAVNGTSNTRG